MNAVPKNGMKTETVSMRHQKKFGVRTTILAVLLGLVTAGCFSSTVINSRPEGAAVYIDGVKKGTTPYRHRDALVAGAVRTLRLEKEGYRPLNDYIRKGEFKPDACAGGVLCLFPFIWITGYPSAYEFNLEKH